MVSSVLLPAFIEGPRTWKPWRQNHDGSCCGNAYSLASSFRDQPAGDACAVAIERARAVFSFGDSWVRPHSDWARCDLLRQATRATCGHGGDIPPDTGERDRGVLSQVAA